MSNIMTYLTWRGDLPLEYEPFNAVDSLILSEFAYFDFLGVVPETGEDGSITVADAYVRLLGEHNGIPVKALSATEDYFVLWEKMAASKRFGNARLFEYEDVYDEHTQIQFAALHIALDDGTTFIAFRGTDQTILGWREDFAMSFEVVAAQRAATAYVTDTMRPGGRYRLGGHSKGGNLAIYAAMTCGDEQKSQIIDIYSNDGPGFCPEVFPMHLYEAISERVHLTVPEYCIIGNLYGRQLPEQIVKCEVEGILQHKGLTWMVEGGSFVQAGDFTPNCKAMNQVVDTWVEDVSMEEHPVFMDEFFNALAAGGAKNIDEVAKNGVGGFESILTAMVDTKKDTKSVIGKLIKAFMLRVKKLDIINLLKTQMVYRGFLLVFAGLLFTWLPANAVRILATAGLFVLVFLLGKRLVHHIIQKKSWTNVGKYSALFYTVAIVLLVAFSMFQGAFVISTDFGLGALCCMYGYHHMKKGIEMRSIKKPMFWVSMLRALLSTMLGMVALIEAGGLTSGVPFTVGTFLIIEGIAAIVGGTYKKIRAPG